MEGKPTGRIQWASRSDCTACDGLPSCSPPVSADFSGLREADGPTELSNGQSFLIARRATFLKRRAEGLFSTAVLSSPQELFRLNSRFAKNRLQGSFGHVAGMMGQRHLAAGGGLTPDFVASRSRTVKCLTKSPQPSGNLPILQSSQTTHQRTPTGITRSNEPPWANGDSEGGNGSPCSRQDSAIFRTNPWAISTASTTLRPSATRPGTSLLVAT